MIDVTRPQSPGWWLNRLHKQLGDRQRRLNKLDRYYKGDCDLPEGADNCRDSYRRFQRKARANFAELVVEAVRERMMPVGFRTGASGDELGDKEAWRIWQANSLDADSSLVTRASLSMSDAYVIVGAVDDEIGAPVITAEDPRQVITAHDPIRRRKVVAAAKVFSDEVTGFDRAFLYLPGEVFQAQRKRAARASGSSAWSSPVMSWEWTEAVGDEGDRIAVRDPVPDELDHRLVPVVRFANRADLYSDPMGEFESVLDVLDRINHMVLQRLVIATIQAFRQRAIKGVPTHDPQGNEIDYNGLFPADPGAMWHLPDGADIWESDQVNLQGILSAVRHDVQDLAAMTRTPLFYLTPDAANGSAEGASLARENLIFKVADRIGQASESWEQVMALAFLSAGDEQRASRRDMECIWAPPERFSLAERYDAASKASAAGVPWRAVMGDVLQFSPQQVDRMESERVTDAFLSAPDAPVRVPVGAA